MKIALYHAGYLKLPRPDVHYGRKNADFGQGFYTTRDADFARRWARERAGCTIWINAYELELDGLAVHHFERDQAWFDYIYDNRRGAQDAHPEADVIAGPIANDTIFDTLGITTSGLLSRAEALQLLTIGPLYIQFALKTEKAAAQLVWKEALALTGPEAARYRAALLEEEQAYQALFASTMEKIMG